MRLGYPPFSNCDVDFKKKRQGKRENLREKSNFNLIMACVFAKPAEKQMPTFPFLFALCTLAARKQQEQ